MYFLPNETGFEDCFGSNNNYNNNGDRRIVGTNSDNASMIGRGEAHPPPSNSALVSLLGAGNENLSRPHNVNSNTMMVIIRSDLVDILFRPASSCQEEPSSDDSSGVGTNNMHLSSVLQPSSASDVISSSDHLIAILDDALDILSDLPPTNNNNHEQDRDIPRQSSATALPPSFEQQ